MELVSVRTVIHQRFLEPRMLQYLLGGCTLLWVVNKDPPEQIEELAAEVGVTGDGFL